MCRCFLLISTPCLFARCQLGEPKRHRRAIFLSHGSQEMPNWREATDQLVSFFIFFYFSLFCSFITAFDRQPTSPSAYTQSHLCIKVMKHSRCAVRLWSSCGDGPTPIELSLWDVGLDNDKIRNRPSVKLYFVEHIGTGKVRTEAWKWRLSCTWGTMKWI